MARTCLFRAFGLQVSCRLSPVSLLFCFVFVFILSLKPRPSVQLFFDMQAPRQPHVFLSFFLLFLWRCRFFRVFLLPLPFYRCMKSTPYVLSFRVVFFYLVASEPVQPIYVSPSCKYHLYRVLKPVGCPVLFCTSCYHWQLGFLWGVYLSTLLRFIFSTTNQLGINKVFRQL